MTKTRFRNRLDGVGEILSYLNAREKMEFILRRRVLIYTDRGAIHRVYFDPLFEHSGSGVHSAIYISNQMLIEYILSREKQPVADEGKAYVYCSVPYFSPLITSKMASEKRFIAMILLLKADDHYVLRNSNPSISWKTTKKMFITGKDPEEEF